MESHYFNPHIVLPQLMIPLGLPHYNIIPLVIMCTHSLRLSSSKLFPIVAYYSLNRPLDVRSSLTSCSYQRNYLVHHSFPSLYLIVSVTNSPSLHSCIKPSDGIQRFPHASFLAGSSPINFSTYILGVWSRGVMYLSLIYLIYELLGLCNGIPHYPLPYLVLTCSNSVNYFTMDNSTL
jgi:hypothetical protein